MLSLDRLSFQLMLAINCHLGRLPRLYMYQSNCNIAMSHPTQLLAHMIHLDRANMIFTLSYINTDQYMMYN